MAHEVQESERKQRIDDQKRNTFSEFMSDPLTRVVMSIIPAGDHQDALRSLLETAFNKGHSCGQSAVLIEMVTAMFDRKKSEGGRDA